MSDQKSIKDTLSIIRKALEDDDIDTVERNDDFLLLNKLVNDDGTIKELENSDLSKEEIKEILSNKITQYFDTNLDKWLDKNIPNHLDKYFKNK